MTYSAFMFLTATPAWLALTPPQREEVVARELQPILARHGDSVQTQYYDTEAYYARASDLLVLYFDAPDGHTGLIDELRSSSIFTKPYFILEELLIGKRAAWLESRE